MFIAVLLTLVTSWKQAKSPVRVDMKQDSIKIKL